MENETYVEQGLREHNDNAVWAAKIIAAGMYGATAVLAVIAYACSNQSAAHLVSCFKHLF